MVVENFTKDVKQLIFDKFSNIVFDNYIQQKGLYLSKTLCKLPKKYSKIDKSKIIKQIENYIDSTLYSKKIYKLVKVKLYNFFEILEDIFYKINSNVNVQDEYLILMNVF
jgi:5-bromo-4-chloroindolyl phosphate hydrolysis protein